MAHVTKEELLRASKAGRAEVARVAARLSTCLACRSLAESLLRDPANPAVREVPLRTLLGLAAFERKTAVERLLARADSPSCRGIREAHKRSGSSGPAPATPPPSLTSTSRPSAHHGRERRRSPSRALRSWLLRVWTRRTERRSRRSLGHHLGRNRECSPDKRRVEPRPNGAASRRGIFRGRHRESRS